MIGQRDLTALVSFFEGNWDADETRTRMRVVEFWKGSGVRWLYFEWVSLSDESKPLRQVVMRMGEDGNGNMSATMHRLPGSAARFAGEWKKPAPFAAFEPADLREIPGCRMKAQRTMAAHFLVMTEGNKCPGDIAGVPAVRYEFSLASSELDLLEQPRDAAGEVPPGSRREPYQYKRMSREPK